MTTVTSSGNCGFFVPRSLIAFRLGFSVALATSTSALAQMLAPAPSAADQPEEDSGDIIVNGVATPRGSVIGNVQPEERLTPADIRSFGVSSISELLTELSPQTDAANGAPVVLLNGKRISGFSEIRDYPTEAIARVDILPPEVSLSYGYSPNQKVVNIVLRRRFKAVLADLRGGIATEGDRKTGSATGNLLHIQGDNRVNLDVKYTTADRLLESDRGVATSAGRRPYAIGGNILSPTGGEIDPALSALVGMPVTSAAVPASAASGAPQLSDFVPGANIRSVSDLGRFRTLSPATDTLTLNGVYARTLPGNISGSLNGRLDYSTSDSLRGLPSTDSLTNSSLLIPAGNPYSPFADPVQLYRYFDQAGPLAQHNKSVTGHVGLTLNGDLKPWHWSFTGNYDRAVTRTSTARGFDLTAFQDAITAGNPLVNPFGVISSDLLNLRLADKARATATSLGGSLLLNGPLFELPAGKATASVTLGASDDGFHSRSERSGILSTTDFSRQTVSGELNVDLPIASSKNNILGAIGDLSLNGNVGVQHLSDFGTLSTVGYGLNWTPIPQIRLIASVAHDKAAPSGQQIDNPAIVTPNVPVFDPVTGQSVFVQQIDGGNPALRQSNRRQIRIGATIKPIKTPDLSLTATYTNSRTNRPIASFPEPTAQIAAAFPDRFIRDIDGTLTQIDARPINFAQSNSSQLRWGFNLSIPVKSHLQKQIEAWRAAGSKPEDRPEGMQAMMDARRQREARRAQQEGGAGAGGGGGENVPGGGGEGGAPANGTAANTSAGSNTPGTNAAPGGGGGNAANPRRGFGGFGGGGRGPNGRIQLALYHTWHFTDSVLIAPGVPRLDLLDGAAIGSSGGQPRHELQGQAGYSNNGLGARLSANWQSATHVDGTSGVAASDLRFSDLTTLNLRLFADLSQMPKLVRDHPFFRGARITLAVTNLLNDRQKVTNGLGVTPARYQSAYFDPVGRQITISFRKLFF